MPSSAEAVRADADRGDAPSQNEARGRRGLPLAAWMQPAAAGRSLRDAQIGELLRDRAEHAVELACLADLEIHFRLGRAVSQQVGIAVDHADRVDLDIIS